MEHSRGEDLIRDFVKKIGSKLEAKDKLKDVSTRFAQCKTDYERAAVTLQLDEVHEVIQVPVRKESVLKSAEVAAKFRNDGNAYFKRKRDQEALQLYTQSITYAPADSESGTDLALGYANRSAVLFHLQKHEACVNDIRRALIANYPKDLHYKVYDRQAKSLRALKKYQLAGEAYHNLSNSLEHAKLDEVKLAQYKKDIDNATAAWARMAFKGMSVSTGDIDDQIARNKEPPRLGANPNSHFPSLSRRCDVAHSGTGGRYIRAAEDIQTGEVLVVERPFASVLLPEQHGVHCHACLVRCDVMVPCRMCTHALYCSETCRSQADTTFHRYECSILEHIAMEGLGKFAHLALRAVTVKGADFFRRFRESKQEASPINDIRLQGCDSEGKYREDDYSAIYSLVGNAERRKPNDLFWRSVVAAYLLKCLQQSQFFHDNTDESFVTYICGLILSHLQSFPCNAHEISEMQLDKNNIVESVSSAIGAGIYSTLSLFNHSCVPMATRHFYGDTCVVRSIRPGRKGCEIPDNYGAVPAVQSKTERDEMLQTQYFFECQCIACTENWPLYLEIPEENPILICTECQTEVPDGDVQCPNCSIEVNISEKQRAIKLATEKYCYGVKKLAASDVSEAMKHFIKGLNLCHGNVKLPWRYVDNCQEGLKQCYSILGNCYVLPTDNRNE